MELTKKSCSCGKTVVYGEPELPLCFGCTTCDSGVSANDDAGASVPHVYTGKVERNKETIDDVCKMCGRTEVQVAQDIEEGMQLTVTFRGGESTTYLEADIEEGDTTFTEKAEALGDAVVADGDGFYALDETHEVQVGQVMAISCA